MAHFSGRSRAKAASSVNAVLVSYAILITLLYVKKQRPSEVVTLTQATATTAPRQTLENECPRCPTCKVCETCQTCPTCETCKECTCPSCQVCEQQPAGTVTTTQVASSQYDDGVYLPRVNLERVLGEQGALSFISETAYMAYRCVASVKNFIKEATDEELAKVQQELQTKIVDILKSINGNQPVDTNEPVIKALKASSVHDKNFLQARQQISQLVATYTLDDSGRIMCCRKDPPIATAIMLGKQQCAPGEAEECIGYLTGVNFLIDPIETLAKNVVLTDGYCTDTPQYTNGYADYLATVKTGNDSWKLFNVGTLDEDTIIFSFQLLYEHHTVFLRQYWLGVVAMQNPFDAWSIQDIIYTLRPDLIIEAGTANGGSALMWASIMHLANIDGKVITIDLKKPEDMSWAKQRENPWDNHLWKKYVTFVQGSSIDPNVFEKIKTDYVTAASTVLVLLDSSHQPDHVIQEAEMYCPMATNGSYCLIQDLKLDRLGWHGPLSAARQFVAKHPEFMVDRSREMLFTDHPGGYLMRIKP